MLHLGTIFTELAVGSEIYVGCSNGELIRFALQADDPNKVSGFLEYQAPHSRISQLESYRVLSRQTVPNDKPVDEIVLIPSLSRAFILSGISVHLLLFDYSILLTNYLQTAPCIFTQYRH
jgi:hypothetical protein